MNAPVLDEVAVFAAAQHRAAREPRAGTAPADPPRCIPAALLAAGGGAAGDQLRAVDALAKCLRSQARTTPLLPPTPPGAGHHVDNAHAVVSCHLEQLACCAFGAVVMPTACTNPMPRRVHSEVRALGGGASGADASDFPQSSWPDLRHDSKEVAVNSMTEKETRRGRTWRGWTRGTWRRRRRWWTSSPPCTASGPAPKRSLSASSPRRCLSPPRLLPPSESGAPRRRRGGGGPTLVLGFLAGVSRSSIGRGRWHGLCCM